jgi:hypothetical protein
MLGRCGFLRCNQGDGGYPSRYISTSLIMLILLLLLFLTISEWNKRHIVAEVIAIPRISLNTFHDH